MRPIVFLDMDGVLANFEKYAKEVCGENWKEELESPNWGKIGNCPDIFSKLEPFDDAQDLYRGCVELMGDKNRVQILTALPNRVKFDTAPRDKIEWARKYIDPDIRVIFGPYAQDKKYHKKHPLDVLIDDMPRNIEQWEDVGGFGIVHKDASSSLFELSMFISLNDFRI